MMNDAWWRHSWIWHPGVVALATAVAILAFFASMAQTLSDPPVAVAFVLAAGVALVTGFFLVVLAPLPDEKQPEYNWWVGGTWMVGIFLTMFVLLGARGPGGVLWPALILTVPWYYAVFRAIPPERASRSMRGVLAAFVVAVGASSAPFAWSGNSPMPPLDGAAVGYLWGIAVAVVLLKAGDSWRRVGAVLLLAVSFSSLGRFLPIGTVLLTAYLFAWMRRRRVGSAPQAVVA